MFVVNAGLTVFETGQKKTEKRKKFKENDASNIDGFLGPWAKYVDEKDVAKPSEVSFDVFLVSSTVCVSTSRVCVDKCEISLENHDSSEFLSLS